MTFGISANRRPLKSRGKRWSRVLLALLLKTGITPNQISFASILFASLCPIGWLYFDPAHSALGAVIAMVGIQLRLLCNLMDGMLAVEGNRHSPSGELYNELPDRLSDSIIILGAGYGYRNYFVFGLSGDVLAWIATLLAVFTAYVRAVGAGCGVGHHFLGPMAKPHRMALLTAICLFEIGLHLLGSWQALIPFALLLMIIGSIVTIFRRISLIHRLISAK